MKYRAFLPDWFEDIEADSEDEAKRKMIELAIEELTNRPMADVRIIVWPAE